LLTEVDRTETERIIGRAQWDAPGQRSVDPDCRVGYRFNGQPLPEARQKELLQVR
jgi:hypothetical protein